MPGRPPDPNAQRRGGHRPAPADLAPPGPAAPAALAKTPAVAVNPVMSECWDALVGAAPFLAQQDAALVEAYCYWYAVFRQACDSTMTLDGRVVTTVAKPDPDTGEPDPATARPNPDLRTAERASTMLRQLADALNISPTARIRTGIMAVMAASSAEDLARRTEEGYRRFKAAQGRGALPDA